MGTKSAGCSWRSKNEQLTKEAASRKTNHVPSLSQEGYSFLVWIPFTYHRGYLFPEKLL
uniref:Uncharacterized protein n=1 Tax=Anguilla anguilla TaxID=7936 RepID=A0A0E9RYW0_ANGAN